MEHMSRLKYTYHTQIERDTQHNDIIAITDLTKPLYAILNGCIIQTIKKQCWSIYKTNLRTNKNDIYWEIQLKTKE